MVWDVWKTTIEQRYSGERVNGRKRGRVRMPRLSEDLKKHSLLCPFHELPFPFWGGKDISFSKGIYVFVNGKIQFYLQILCIQTCHACGKFPNKECFLSWNLQAK